MAYAVAATGFVVAVLGIAVIIVPAGSRQIGRWVQSPRLVYAVSSVRVLFGAFFVFASEACAWPMAIGSLGVVVMVVGFAGLFLGVHRTAALFDWFLAFSDNGLRAWALIAVLFGGFVVWAAVWAG